MTASTWPTSLPPRISRASTTSAGARPLPACSALPTPAELRTGAGDVTPMAGVWRGARGTGCASGGAGAPRAGVVWQWVAPLEQPGATGVCLCLLRRAGAAWPAGPTFSNLATAPSHGRWRRGMVSNPAHSENAWPSVADGVGLTTDGCLQGVPPAGGGGPEPDAGVHPPGAPELSFESDREVERPPYDGQLNRPDRQPRPLILMCWDTLACSDCVSWLAW